MQGQGQGWRVGVGRREEGGLRGGGGGGSAGKRVEGGVFPARLTKNLATTSP